MLTIILPQIPLESLFYHEIVEYGSLANLAKTECVAIDATYAKFHAMAVEWVQDAYPQAVVALADTISSPRVVLVIAGHSPSKPGPDRWWEGPGDGSPEIYAHLMELIDRLYGSQEYQVLE